MKDLLFIAVFCALLGLAGCDKTGNLVIDSNLVTSEEGIWFGGFLSPGGGGATISFAFIQDGRFVAVEGDPSNPCHIYAATYDTTQLSGVMRRYAGTATDVNGATPSDACPTGSTADGSLESSSSLNPNPVDIVITMFRSLNIQVGSSRNLIVLQPLTDLYNRTATVELISGLWNFDIPGNTPYNLPLTITPNEDGTILSVTGTDTLGCAYSGTMEIRDPNHNIYRIDDMTLTEGPGTQPGSGCVGYKTQGAERYTGIAAFLDNTPATSTFLAMAVSSPSHAFYILLTKG